MSTEHVGTWTGPGILALLDGEWVHFLERDAPRDPRARAAAFVGMDRPTIAIRLAGGVDEAEDGPAAPKAPS